MKTDIRLYSHQKEALFHLEKSVVEHPTCKGLLVLPTGSGKTMTAMVFIERLLIENKNRKILWLAHRHELLEQAFSTYEKVFGNVKFVQKISGIHESAFEILPTSKCIIASKDSLIRNFDALGKVLEGSKDEWVCIVDEAHHAGARSYRELLTFIESYNPTRFILLGLTATPLRTSVKEKGLLKKIFPTDIIYSSDMRLLISKGILAEPIFFEVETDVKIEQSLSAAELKTIYNLDTMPRELIEHLSNNYIRNQKIVEYYVENQGRFKKTLLFAFNQLHAITLYHMFKKAGVNCDFIISNREMAIDERKKRTNPEVIQAFRNDQIKLLINVEILTEGADFPDVDTLFLTRPTASTILMTQMVGRVLRGIESGGTQSANIVSFIDQWKDKINWVSPRLLMDMENLENAKEVAQKRAYTKQLIIDKKVEEMITVMESSVEMRGRDGYTFFEKLPIGAYVFSYLQSLEELHDRNIMVMVYEHLECPFAEFVAQLPQMVSELKLTRQVNSEEDEALIESVVESIFSGYDLSLGFNLEDIVHMINYFVEKEILPEFFEFDEREKFNLTKLCYFVLDEKMERAKEATYREQVWGRATDTFQHLFNGSTKRFLSELNWEMERILHPKWFGEKPLKVTSKEILENLTIEALKEKFPYFYKRLEQEIFRRYRAEEVGYWSESGHFHSFERADFEILYKIPLNDGGKSRAENCVIIGKHEREAFVKRAEKRKEREKSQNVFVNNERVTHGKFGLGSVIGIDEKYVKVRFSSAGVKNFPLESAEKFLEKC